MKLFIKGVHTTIHNVTGDYFTKFKHEMSLKVNISYIITKIKLGEPSNEGWGKIIWKMIQLKEMNLCSFWGESLSLK